MDKVPSKVIKGMRAVQRRVWTSMQSFRVSRIEGDAQGAYNTGTGLLLEAGATLGVLTAWHVYAHYLQLREQDVEAVVLFGNAPLLPPVVLFQDQRNDIVVLAATADVARLAPAAPYMPSRWPPRHVTTDDLVLVSGLPACLRTESPHELLFGDYSIIQDVSSASDHQFVLHLKPENWMNLGRIAMPGTDVFLGGISGGHVVALNEPSYPLVGIVSEIGATLPLLYAKTLAHLPPRFDD